MDEWDVLPVERRETTQKVLRCDFTDTLRLHTRDGLLYYSLFRSTKEGDDIDAILASEADCERMAEAASGLIDRLLNSTEGWCIIAASERENNADLQISEFVSGLISGIKDITFYKGAVQSLGDELHLLRPIKEKNVIIFEALSSTGAALADTKDLLQDKEQVMCIVGIQKRNQYGREEKVKETSQ